MSDHGSAWRSKLVEFLKANALPPHKYGHQPRLHALTQAIGAATPGFTYDDDVVFAAAFLHDLGVFVGQRPKDAQALECWDHVAYVCDCAPALLERWDFPAAKIDAVLAAIREHQPQDIPHSPEAVLLRDADMLEQLGAVAVLRTASKLGSDTRFVHLTDVRRSLQRALETLPMKLRLSGSRELAASRVAALRSFLLALQEEAGEHLH